MPIVKAPSPVLRTPAKTVEKLDKRIIQIINNLYQSLLTKKDPEGVGIAAPQIGESLRIFFIRPFEESSATKPAPTLFINPEITHFSRDTISPRTKGNLLEGCLSLPGYYGFVRRSKSITVKYQSLSIPVRDRKTSSDFQNPYADPNPDSYVLNDCSHTFSGFTAQVIQHEQDHLNGVMFIDRVLEQNGKLYEVKGENWQEVSL